MKLENILSGFPIKEKGDESEDQRPKEQGSECLNDENMFQKKLERRNPLQTRLLRDKVTGTINGELVDAIPPLKAIDPEVGKDTKRRRG